MDGEAQREKGKTKRKDVALRKRTLAMQQTCASIDIIHKGMLHDRKSLHMAATRGVWAKHGPVRKVRETRGCWEQTSPDT